MNATQISGRPKTWGGRGRSFQLSSWLTRVTPDMPVSTNQPSTELPIQRWFKFKEAFSPQLVCEIVEAARTRAPIDRCIDVFGGCGTTALTSQFLGLHPVLIEVNPFIADLAEAKLSDYVLDELVDDFVGVRSRVRSGISPAVLGPDAPSTLCESSETERWVFPRDVLHTVLQYRAAIEQVASIKNRRLLRVLLGSILVPVSNVTVNGKGRKYRGNWQEQQRTVRQVHESFHRSFLDAVSDVTRYGRRALHSYELLRGSCLTQLPAVAPCDLAIFSPPYPNSFDYTDIYNLELWVLGYLQSKDDNRQLRQATLRSHVQGIGQFAFRVADSPSLVDTLDALSQQRSTLWDPRIPDMVGAYFEDMQMLLRMLGTTLKTGGTASIIVGESSYAGVRVRSGHILREIAESLGFATVKHECMRTMRQSAQQGGVFALEERLLEIKNA